MKPNEKNNGTEHPHKVKPVSDATQLSIAFGEKYMEVEIDIESFIMG